MFCKHLCFAVTAWNSSDSEWDGPLTLHFAVPAVLTILRPSSNTTLSVVLQYLCRKTGMLGKELIDRKGVKLFNQTAISVA